MIRGLTASFGNLSIEVMFFILDSGVVVWGRINVNWGGKKEKHTLRTILIILIFKHVVVILVIIGNLIVTSGQWNQNLSLVWSSIMMSTMMVQSYSFLFFFLFMAMTDLEKSSKQNKDENQEEFNKISSEKVKIFENLI